MLAVGGLVTLALRKPKQYQRLSAFLSPAASFVFILTVAYSIGGVCTELAMHEFIQKGRVAEAYNAAAAVQPNLLWAFVSWVGTLAFLGALYLLPRLLGIGQDGEDDSRNKEDER